MSDTVLAALISSLIGGVLVAIINARANRDRLFRIERKITSVEDYYPDYQDAFPAIIRCLKTQIQYCKKNGVENPVFEMKHIAVSMSFSWDYFITLQIPKLLSDLEAAGTTFHIKAAFVEPKALEGILDPLGRAWAAKSEERLKDIPQFQGDIARKFGHRLTFDHRMYGNLPQWHGWLITTTINNQQMHHLFMGRTKWEFDENDPSEYPRMSVGHNEYRYYTERNTEGRQRIQLFEQWHRYYYNFDTPLVKDFREDLAR